MREISQKLLFKSCLILVFYVGCGRYSHGQALEEKELHEFLRSRYTWPVRPVANYSDCLDVKLRFSLLQIVELNLKNQILTLRVKIEHEWNDYKLKWSPIANGGIQYVTLPSQQIWIPDTFLWNSFGEPDMQKLSNTKATIGWNGNVRWAPTILLKSFCPIEVRHYPFDIQSCKLTFGSWTYDGFQVAMTLKDLDLNAEENSTLKVGMSLDEYDYSTQWDLISIPAKWIVKTYVCCAEPYYTIEFTITMRRQSLFYVTHLILPLAAISYLSLLVFYLPAESGEKITLCVSILMSQIMFLLLMIDNIPVTSLAVPLLGKMIIFDIFIVFCSIVCTTLVLNIYYRKPATTHQMRPWLERICRYVWLHKLLCMEGPYYAKDKNRRNSSNDNHKVQSQRFSNGYAVNSCVCQAMKHLTYLEHHTKIKIMIDEESESWKLLSTILDRIFLILFNFAYIGGHVFILKDAIGIFDGTDESQTYEKKDLDIKIMQRK